MKFRYFVRFHLLFCLLIATLTTAWSDLDGTTGERNARQWARSRSRTAAGQMTAQVTEYDTQVQHGAPCRVSIEQLPLALYVEDERHLSTVRQAAEVWNAAGRALVGVRFFRVTPHKIAGAIPVNFDRRDLPPGIAGATWSTRGLARVQVVGISIRAMDVPQGNLAEVVSHELGHVLGLDHSKNRYDLMADSMRPRRLESGTDVRLTARDLQMLQWLYTRRNAVHIVPTG